MSQVLFNRALSLRLQPPEKYTVRRITKWLRRAVNRALERVKVPKAPPRGGALERPKVFLQIIFAAFVDSIFLILWAGLSVLIDRLIALIDPSWVIRVVGTFMQVSIALVVVAFVITDLYKLLLKIIKGLRRGKRRPRRKDEVPKDDNEEDGDPNDA
jgi:uncharacterized membrane protein YdbT with pleckstrin-like domain